MSRVRRRWVIPLALVALAVSVVAVLAGLALRGVADDLAAARDALRSAEQHVRAGRLAAADQALARAETRVARANGTLHTSTPLAFARLVPGAKQNVDALRRSVGLALALTTGGRTVLGAAEPLRGPDGRLDVSLRGGSIPVNVVRDVDAALKEIAYQLPEATSSRGRWLAGPIRDLEDDVFDEAVRRRRQFISVAQSLEVLAEVAGGNGPRRYLIAVANAAEMRGTGGMILSYGELVSDGGKLSLERFGPIDDLALRGDPPGDPLPYPDRFAQYAPVTTWRNTNLSPDFTVVAPIQEDLYSDVTGKPVNGVIQVDSFGLAALLRITGPVTIPDAPPIDANNVVPFTLNENYFRITARPERQEAQGQVAQAVFERLVTGDFPTVRDLGRVVAEAAEGRHVMLHSTSAPIQRTVRLLGIDGGLPEPGNDVALLTVQNFSGNKLDYYLDTNLTVSGRRPAGTVSRVRVRVDIANTAPPDGRNRAVFGPLESGFGVGEYRGLVSVYFPLGSHLERSSGGGTIAPVLTTTELDRAVVTYGISVPAGGRHSMDLDLLLPARADSQGYRFSVVAVPRVRPTVVTLNIPGIVQRTVAANRSLSFEPD